MPSYKIKSIVFEVESEDGTVEEREVSDEGRIVFATGTDHDASFWFATSVLEVANSNHIIAGSNTFSEYVQEGVTRDYNNTLKGIIEDGNYDFVLCTYTMPGFGLVK